LEIVSVFYPPNIISQRDKKVAKSSSKNDFGGFSLREQSAVSIFNGGSADFFDGHAFKAIPLPLGIVKRLISLSPELRQLVVSRIIDGD
jgi:hypothetical protein